MNEGDQGNPGAPRERDPRQPVVTGPNTGETVAGLGGQPQGEGIVTNPDQISNTPTLSDPACKHNSPPSLACK